MKRFVKFPNGLNATFPLHLKLVYSNNSEHQTKLCLKAMAHVPDLGFSNKALEKASTELGYPSNFYKILPDETTFIHFFLQKSRESMNQQMNQLIQTESLKGTTSIVKQCVVIRLKELEPFVNHWQNALAVLAAPENLANSCFSLSLLIDDMWYLAGDRSLDYNYYTKRALLAGVYSSTELYMTTDKSCNFTATRAFLDRRLADTAQIGMTMGELKKIADFGIESLKGLVKSRF